MAACPPRVVEEKGPCKIRTKNLTSNASVTCNEDENRPSRADDVESCRKVLCAETKEDEVGTENELLKTLSFGEFEDLLQEVSNNVNCATTNNPVVRKLIDSKVIDAKCLENDLSGTNWSFKPLSSSSSRLGGGKDRRSGKSRLESYGASSSLDGGGACGGGAGGSGSAASRTTQGGSLQNLHGKSEGKKSSLHKSGSLNTFPNASSFENYEELAALKSLLAANAVAVNSKTAAAAASSAGINQVKRSRAVGGGTNYGSTNTCCPAVSASSLTSNYSAVVVNRTQCGESKDFHSCASSSTTDCSSSSSSSAAVVVTPNVMEPQQQQPQSSSSSGGYWDALSSCSSSTVTKAEMMTDSTPSEDKEMQVMMMEVDTNNDGVDSEKIPLLKTKLSPAALNSSSNAVTNGNAIETIQGRSTEITEVDSRITMPVLYQMKQYPKHEMTSNLTHASSCSEEWPCNSLAHLHPTYSALPMVNGRQFDSGTDRNRRDMNRFGLSRGCDDNGNPIHISCPTTVDHYGSYNRATSISVCGREPESGGGGSTDIANRARKKPKASNKQRLIDPQQIDGYFGSLEIEDILKRMNYTDEQDTNKLRSSVVDGKSKKAGSKAKKIVSHKEIRKNSENEILRVNGTKEDGGKHPGFEMAIDAKEGNRIGKKTANVATDEGGTSSGSHSPELDADDKIENSNQKESSTSHSDHDANSSADGIVSVNKPVQVDKEQVDVSSFVSDFYSTAESQSVVEDSEFHEVIKKKKKKPRSMYSSRSEGGSGTNTYHRYQRYSGVEESDGGRNSSSAASWAGLSTHRRGLYSSDDVRRKSTSSMPPSDHSSPDNSDVESVHSLPAGSTTLRPTISKMSNSSSCTPQASYADIAKMTTVAVDSSNNYRFSTNSSTIPPNQHSAQFNNNHNETETEKRKEVWLSSMTPLVPLESEENCVDDQDNEDDEVNADVDHRACSPPQSNNSETDVKTMEESHQDEPSVSSMTSSVERENSCGSPCAPLPQPPSVNNPGVEFVGGLELPEDTIEVTFGFEVNEQLLLMTDAELMAAGPTDNHHDSDSQLLPRTEPMIIGANVIYLNSSELDVVVVDNQGLIISSHVSTSPLPIPTAAAPLSEQLTQRSDGETAFSQPLVINAEPIYTESPSVDHQNIVDYIGLDWLKVSEELEREPKDRVSRRVRYYNNNNKE